VIAGEAQFAHGDIRASASHRLSRARCFSRERLAFSAENRWPLFLRAVTVAPAGSAWVHEIKQDGYRLMGGTRLMAIAASGAHFEIKIDDVIRSHRDERHTAIEAARFLQQRNPGAKIAVTDMRDGSVVSFDQRGSS
jgi:hypothetical protein